MTYRERRLAKAERLREWAAKRNARSASAFTTARVIADGIPLGQPILVGHHSEKRHRRDVERIDSAMRRGCENATIARSMTSRADNIEDAAERAIYRDDTDALERLQDKIAGLEARRAQIKAANAAIRKHGLQRLLEPDPPFVLADADKTELLTLMRITPYHHVETRGFPSYALQNLGGTITRERKRLSELVADRTPQGAPVVSDDGETATARAGLIIQAGMTTPSRPGKQPRPVWTVSGNVAFWRCGLMHLGANSYRGTLSFWEDPTADIEAMCLDAEATEDAKRSEQAQA